MNTSTLTLVILAAFALSAAAEQCGSQANGNRCPNSGECCSKFGWCGRTSKYCGSGKCQSQCPSTTSPVPNPPVGNPGGGVAGILTEAVFNQLLKYRNDNRCSSKGFYTYNAFIAAANSFSGFGTTGDSATCKREIAAFLAQTSHETTGGWASAPDGAYAWGYCFINERNNPPAYCSSTQWPCAAGKKYYGRGPIQLTHNYNYGPAGRAIGVDLINNPDLVATDATVSFKTAVWFWMTAQGSKPSSHSVITGQWKPSAGDRVANRVAGFGVITNIINGGLECGHGQDNRVQDRIGFYKRYCGIFGVADGGNLDCNNQKAFS